MTAAMIALDILKSQNFEKDTAKYSISLAQYKEDISRFVFFVTNLESGKNNKYELGANNCTDFAFLDGPPTFEDLPKGIQEDIHAGRL